MSNRHKHADIIHAWAEGAEIEVSDKFEWRESGAPSWNPDYEYRIKPEKKPDVVASAHVYPGHFCLECDYGEKTRPVNLQCTFSGETGELLSAEVLK